MKVVLLADVKGQGKKGDTVNADYKLSFGGMDILELKAENANIKNADKGVVLIGPEYVHALIRCRAAIPEILSIGQLPGIV